MWEQGRRKRRDEGTKGDGKEQRGEVFIRSKVRSCGARAYGRSVSIGRAVLHPPAGRAPWWLDVVDRLIALRRIGSTSLMPVPGVAYNVYFADRATRRGE